MKTSTKKRKVRLNNSIAKLERRVRTLPGVLCFKRGKVAANSVSFVLQTELSESGVSTLRSIAGHASSMFAETEDDSGHVVCSTYQVTSKELFDQNLIDKHHLLQAGCWEFIEICDTRDKPDIFSDATSLIGCLEKKLMYLSAFLRGWARMVDEHHKATINFPS